MKKIIYGLLGIVTLFAACDRDRELVDKRLEVENEQLIPSYYSISVECNFATKATIQEAYVLYSTLDYDDVSQYDRKQLLVDSNGRYVAVIDQLRENTVYHICYETKNSYSSCCTKSSSVKTLASTVAGVTTDSVSNIETTSATIWGGVSYDGGKPITERGIVYATFQNPKISGNKITCGEGIGSFSTKLNEMRKGTTYYVRAYAINSNGTAYGEQLSFTTNCTVPTVVTMSASNITASSARLGGNVVEHGGVDITERGIVYSTNSTPTISDNKMECGIGVGSFFVNLTGLSELTTYYARAYAVNGNGIAYGEEISFTTKMAVLPSVITAAATQITRTTAVTGGDVLSDGGASVTERGVVYSTNQNPTTSNSKVVSGSGTGSFICNLTGLQENTTYYVRAYAINSKGTAYGQQINLTVPYENGHEYVDLGVSVKWATCNVGASKPEDYGDYFAWGEVEPKEVYNWSTYKWGNSAQSLTKYNNDKSLGVVDNKMELDLSDDAAHANWGGNWRMPSLYDLHSLLTNCD